MKKILVVLVLFCAFFIVSCGDNNSNKKDNNKNENSDTEESVTDEDSADTDPSDSGHENPDTASEQSDNGDSAPDNDDTESDNDYHQSPCNPNPCISDVNSTGVCTINNDSYVCSCKSGYIFDGTLCIKSLPECSQTSTTPCIDSATGLIWSEKSQKRMRWIDAVEYCKNLHEGNFSDWQLPSIAVLRTLVKNCNNSAGCDGNADGYYSKFGDIVFFWSSTGGNSTAQGIYFFNGSSLSKNVDGNFDVRCVRRETSSRLVNCSFPSENAQWNTVSQITQNWDWNTAEWIPNTVSSYNEEPSTTECRFVCEDEYHFEDEQCRCKNWNGVKCLENVAENECSPTSGTPCIDSSSGLIWSKTSSDKVGIYSNVNEAKDYCNNLTEWGYSWRLPSISELRTLIQNCPATETNGINPYNDCYLKGYSYCKSAEYAYLGTRCSEYNTTSYDKFGDGSIFASSFWAHGEYAPCSFLSIDFGDASIKEFQCAKGKVYVRCVRSGEIEGITKAVVCLEPPENTVWNTVDVIMQTYNGTDWKPSNNPIYNTEPSTKECRYKCKPGYIWNGSQCINPCQDNPCTDSTKPICTATTTGFTCSNLSSLPECINGTPCKVGNLTWSARSTSSMKWQDAIDYCNNYSESGLSGWRLPTISELRTLIQDCPTTQMPSIGSDTCGVNDNCLSSDCGTSNTCKTCSWDSSRRHSKFVESGQFWSSSIISDYDEQGYRYRWGVNFDYGHVEGYYHSDGLYVRCVR